MRGERASSKAYVAEGREVVIPTHSASQSVRDIHWLFRTFDDTCAPPAPSAPQCAPPAQSGEHQSKGEGDYEPGSYDSRVIWVVGRIGMARTAVGGASLSTQASTEGLTRSHRTTAEGVNGRAKSSRAGREHGCSTVPARDTRRAAPRPDMARAVSTEREGIAAASEPFRHRCNHGGVADH